MEETMKTMFGRLAGVLVALALGSGVAAAQSKITVALKAVLGGSADVVSGYFDHCVNLAAKKQELVSFVVYDRYPGLVLVVSPSHTSEIKSIKDLAGKKVGVSAPGSSTDFFLKYLLKKNGIDPTGASVIGVGLGATAVAAMEQGQIDAAVMLDPSVTVLQGSHPDLKILSDTRTQKDTLGVFGGENAGRDRRQEQGAVSGGAEEHDPDVFGNRQDGSQGRRRGARGVQRRLAGRGEGQYRRHQDLHQQICRSGQEDHGDERQVRGLA